MLTTAAWLGLGVVVVTLDPDPLLHRGLFFAALFLAAFGAFSLLAYRLSFSLFSSKRYRGNVSRSVLHGLTTAIVITVAALLQLSRALTTFTGLLLFGTFVVLQVAVLVRR
ncbi:MAG: hypothetical protein HYY04_12525 [Chloroflexi bacterium]|nr:hypothetical protein [Chloroflexota bacterium]